MQHWQWGSTQLFSLVQWICFSKSFLGNCISRGVREVGSCIHVFVVLEVIIAITAGVLHKVWGPTDN